MSLHVSIDRINVSGLRLGPGYRDRLRREVVAQLGQRLTAVAVPAPVSIDRFATRTGADGTTARGLGAAIADGVAAALGRSTP